MAGSRGDDGSVRVDGGDLTLVSGAGAPAGPRAQRLGLLQDVFGASSEPGAGSTWFGLFARDGSCVANIDVLALRLVLAGASSTASGIGSVAVSPSWRGRGLYRLLMREALAHCEAIGSPFTLLYAETPSLYQGFGFEALPQHAFVGPAPQGLPSVSARKLRIGRPADERLMASLFERRAPLSLRCSLEVDAQRFMRNVAADRALAITLVSDESTMIVHEDDGDELVIVDIVAAEMPSLETVVGACHSSAARLKVLFPPDRLGWRAKWIPEETGLMRRGAVPLAMLDPFMLPPTVEF